MLDQQTQQRTKPPKAGKPSSLWMRIAKIAGVLVGLGVFSAAVWVIWKQVQMLEYDAVMAQFDELSLVSILLALACTFGAYITLTIYDSTAFRYIGRKMRFLRIMMVAFIAYAFSHNLGFGAVTGNSIRYRFYLHWNVSLLNVTKVVVFGGTAYMLGLIAIAGVLVLVNAQYLVLAADLPLFSAYLLGAGAVSAGLVYLTWSLARRPTIAFKGVSLPPPSLSIVTTQFGAALVEWGLAAGALYFLLPVHGGVNYFQFVGIFVIAYITGMISQVPGGLGVFEAVLLLLLPDDLSRETIVAAVITYRAVYFLLPLLIAAVLMMSAEVTIQGRLKARFAWWRRQQRRQN